MCILASANATIVSTGTFGWWGAFLNGGEATVQKDQAVPGSPHALEYVYRDYLLPHWVAL